MSCHCDSKATLRRAPIARAKRTSLDGMDAATKKARNKEQIRRSNLVSARAYADLADLFPEEFKELFVGHRVAVDAEFGPLPGD